MNLNRREFAGWAGTSLAAAAVPGAAGASSSRPAKVDSSPAGPFVFSVKKYGAIGDGKTIDSAAVNAAIEAASASGGGTVHFPAGVYGCYSIRLKSHITLQLDQGATILAADTPHDGLSSGGYDAAEPQGAWEPYQDYGHNHWHNSLIWGEGIHDVAILGPGLIWGRGLSRGWDDESILPDSNKRGVGNKAIALKNCHNVTLRDFSILQGGWFGLLATGVDNLTVDNLIVDTNRDGFDFDCCKNVRVSNCTVNSPWDDGICPKSSYALGYPRVTENITISNCMVTGGYQMGSVLDGTWKPHEAGTKVYRTGRIKLGTESNGGFRNIAIANCVFDNSHGFILESEDGAVCEDITLTNIAMRNTIGSPIFIRLGSRMRGPKDAKVGSIRRISISNVTSSGATSLPSIISGIPGYPIEDVKLSNLYLHQEGGGTAGEAGLEPPENETKYPDPEMFGKIPATGFFLRHIRNLEVSNVEIATEAGDQRAAFWLRDLNWADFFRVRVPTGSSSGPAFSLQKVGHFRVFGCQSIDDTKSDYEESRRI